MSCKSLPAPLVRGAVGGSRLRGSLSFSLPPSFAPQMPPPSSEGGYHKASCFCFASLFLFIAKALSNHATIAWFSFTKKALRTGRSAFLHIYATAGVRMERDNRNTPKTVIKVSPYGIIPKRKSEYYNYCDINLQYCDIFNNKKSAFLLLPSSPHHIIAYFLCRRIHCRVGSVNACTHEKWPTPSYSVYRNRGLCPSNPCIISIVWLGETVGSSKP